MNGPAGAGSPVFAFTLFERVDKYTVYDDSHNGFNHEMAGPLLRDLEAGVTWLDALSGPRAAADHPVGDADVVHVPHRDLDDPQPGQKVLAPNPHPA